MQTVQEQIERLKTTIAKQEIEIMALEKEVDELHHEIAPFEKRFNRVVQPVLDRIDAVKAAIQDIEDARRGRRSAAAAENLWQQVVDNAPPNADSGATAEQDPLPSSKKAGVKDESLKAIYRRLARQYHPDLATDEADRERRNRLMAMINAAYQDGDRHTLITLSEEADTEESAQKTESDDLKMPLDKLKLVQLQQHSADLAVKIADLKIEHHDLMYGTLMDLKIQEKLEKAKGRDLLGDLVQDYEREYHTLMKRLDRLRTR